jgi:hypothetical protein
MQKNIRKNLIYLTVCLSVITFSCKKSGSDTSDNKAPVTETTEITTQNGYQLTVITKDMNFSKSITASLVKTFFTVYPEIAQAYNPAITNKVTFIIDPAYDGVAATTNAVVTFSSKYMTQNPNDIDVVTHEVTHIVQDYGNSTYAGWLTEGIADFSRNKFGVNNAAVGWSLATYQSGQNYDAGYQVTARFLLWIENKVKPDFVKLTDAQLRAHTFTDDTWKQLTGKTLTELWAAYTSNPTL